LCRKDKKLQAKERKAKRQKNFNLIQEATKLWESLRQSNTPKEKKQQLVSQILEICDDRVADLAGSHTASRIIQSCVKHGSPEHRLIIQNQLLPKIIELSKNPYGRFIVSKLIVTAPKDQTPGTILPMHLLGIDTSNGR
jgi:pumilio family protein 6